MLVYKLTKAQADLLKDKDFISDNDFNPILNNGNWIISKEEVERCVNPEFSWVKDLPTIDYVEPIENK